MGSLLNPSRPAVFCPGCSHEKVLHALDKVLIGMGYAGEDVVIVTDIGCSGLFDTFFNTHAFHGLHGRALTYATGIKMARPDLKVIVTMGDGGLGIGGAHVLSTCRRNIDLTLLVLNNFNYGMTGGQFSPTTPQNAVVGSGFLNRLEKPLDICRVAGAAGAPWVSRTSAYHKDLVEQFKTAIAFDGFSVVDIRGICPGRYTRRNKLTPGDIEANLSQLPELPDYTTRNAREEYGSAYRREASRLKAPRKPVSIEATCSPPRTDRQEVVLLGSAGQRIITAGELLCLAAASAGCHATQKNDYPITVMKGYSVTEVIVAGHEIDYTGVENPGVVIALASEGVNRRKRMLSSLQPESLVIRASDVKLPECSADVMEVDFKERKIKSADRALGSLAMLARQKRILNISMLTEALKRRFNQTVFEAAMSVTEKFAA